MYLMGAMPQHDSEATAGHCRGPGAARQRLLIGTVTVTSEPGPRAFNVDLVNFSGTHCRTVSSRRQASLPRGQAPSHWQQPSGGRPCRPGGDSEPRPCSTVTEQYCMALQC
jgi:hypothetical protein